MPSKKPLKLNLGCGGDLKPGWVNVDILPELHPDVIHDLSQPLPFPDACACDVIAQDILEHFTYEDVDHLIAEISRVLNVDGRLQIRVPNVEQIIEQFADQPWVRNHFLYGNTEATGVFGAHKMGFTPEVLLTKMMKVGLYPEKLSKVHTNYEATFIRHASSGSSSKKLAYINQSLSIGGAETFILDLLHSFQTDLQYTVIAYTNSARFTQMLQGKMISTEAGAVVIDVIGNWKGLLKAVALFPFAWFQYLKIVWRSKDADVILVSGFSEKILVTPIAYLLGIQVVWVEFSPLSSVFHKFFTLPKLLYRLVKDLPAGVVVPTNYTKQYLIPETRIDLSRMQVIPCGRRFSNTLLKMKKTIDVHVVCISRMEKGKGQELLVAAFALILKWFPEARLQFVGEGDNISVVQEAVKANKLEKSVDFLGFVPDVYQYIHRSDVCVFPSMWELEGFGMVMIEAMSLGRPVVAFARGPALEIIQHEVTGLLAKPGDVEDLAEQILFLLHDQNRANLIGKQSMKIVREKYSIQNVAQQYNTFFDQVDRRKAAQKWIRNHSQE